MATRELVKKNTSSKKSDENPRADPTKAKPKKPVTGNEGAIKNKLDNKSTPGPSSTPSSHYKRPLDRHSRTKKGGVRKPRSGEDGEDALEQELEAEEDAEAELEVDPTPKNLYKNTWKN